MAVSMRDLDPAFQGAGQKAMTKYADLILNSWRDLLKNPKQWHDHRENKLNGSVKPKHQDFKHKDI